MEKEEGVDGKELKTLKDLDIEKLETYNQDEAVKISELRAEAMKWIKALKDDYQVFQNFGESSQKIESVRCPINLFIKHFFNLTEEDLK